jgi:hypothetical protein
MVEENTTSRRNNQGDLERRSFDVTLVHWENAGFLPEFWEYTEATNCFKFDWTSDWAGRVHEFLQAWPTEMAMMHFILRGNHFI